MKYHNIKPEGKPGPYEKFLERGAQALSDAELLAIILRTGTAGTDTVSIAEDILGLSGGGDRGLLGLYHLSLEELMGVKGIGRVKAIKLKCITELSSRMSMQKAQNKIFLNQPSSIADYYMERLRHYDREEVILMMFDGRNHLMGDSVLTSGTANASLVSSREVVVKALKHGAVYIILLHNHPAGDPSPSPMDIKVTQKVVYATSMVDIPLIDHIIIGDNCYFSFREQGILQAVNQTPVSASP